jgi:hypothetical protein
VRAKGEYDNDRENTASHRGIPSVPPGTRTIPLGISGHKKENRTRARVPPAVCA